MADEEEEKRSDSRKPRREAIQIYRPGMFKKGVDATISGEPSSGSKPPEAPKRPPKIQTSPIHSARSTGITGRLYQESRRRSNDTESVHSYRGDSGSTTPDAASLCGERKNSWSRGGIRTFTRGGGGGGHTRERNNDSMSECSVQSYSSMRSDRVEFTNSSRRGQNGGQSQNQPYNSTQSLYNARQPGGYLDSPNPPKQRPLPRNLPGGSRFVRNGPQNERASMRAETGQRRVGGRRRNDSINSTQSERPQPTQELTIDTGAETQSQAGDALSTTSMDYLSLCKSFESIGSFDWTQEMEEHERRMDEEKTKELQKRLEACSNGLEVQKAVSENHGRIRGIIRLNIEDGPPAVLLQQQGLSRENERPPSHLRNKRGGRDGNQRRGSDCSSSVAGSIVEEDEGEENCFNSGERTPTDSRPPSVHGTRERRNSKNIGRNKKSSTSQEFQRSNELSRPERSAEFSGRLAGRVTIQQNGGTTRFNRTEPRGVYQPPAVRRAADTISTTSGPKSNRDSGREMIPRRAPQQQQQKQPNDLFQEISQDEGPRIRKLNDAIADCLPRVSQKKDLAAGEKLLRLSSELCEIYYDLVVKDIAFTFSNNLEQHLWKQAFHKIIDGMRKGTNSLNTNAKAIRTLLLQLIDEGISFYSLLLGQYEHNFDVTYESALYWPAGLPLDDFCSLLPSEPPVVYEKSSQKLAIKSISRHLLSLGDLCRYKSLVEGNEDYSNARSWYLKAAALWPSSGHPYNQLAVVAYFSERVLDEIFFCVRAISAGHPFDAARDRLSARLAAMRKKVEKYEPLLDSECGRVKTELLEIGVGQREHWLPLSGKTHPTEPSTSQPNPSQLHRRTISYMIHTAGLIISKIGMEQFGSVSERAFSQMDALLSLEDAPITAQQLIQIAMIFIYAVHASAMKGDSDTFSVQQQTSVQTLVTFLGVLLKSLKPDRVKNFFTNGEFPPKQMVRVLPAVSVICEWLCCSRAAVLYRDLPSMEPLEFSEFSVDTWELFASLSNCLTELEDSQLLAAMSDEKAPHANILPELLYLASSLTVFPSIPRSINVNPSSESNIDASIHVRLRSILLAAEFLDGSQIQCIFYDEAAGSFRKRELDSSEVVSVESASTVVGDQTVESEPLSREQLLEREKKRQMLLVVKPHNLVPDTNALVDHLDLLEKIVQSGLFQVLVPTIVIDELLGLSKAPGSDGAHAEKVVAEARRCVAWLREKAKQKCPRMNTLTTQGQKLVISIVSEDTPDYGTGQVNDDRILQCCTSYAERNPAPIYTEIVIPACASALYRNVVLLSEDRGMCIKATSQNIPTRTVPHLIKWAGIS